MMLASAPFAAPMNRYNPPSNLPVGSAPPSGRTSSQLPVTGPVQSSVQATLQPTGQPAFQPVGDTQPGSLQPRLPFAQRPEDRFVIMGDAGTGDEGQAAVARQLSRWQQAVPFKSVMVLGDNVYQDGEPALFQERIARPYEPLFQQGVKFFPVMGNHDVKKGFGNWQLAYWGVPPYYNVRLGPKGSEVEFFAIDTNLLTPGMEEHGQGAAAEVRQKSAAQMQWLEHSLAASTAPMKVIYGHHPMYSRGAATKPIRAWQQQALAQQLEPLLAKYGVDFYMAGHEHHYEKPRQVNGTWHVVSGAGGKLDTARRGGPEGNGLVKQLHFMLFDITPQGLTYRTVAGDGRVIDSGLIPRRNAAPGPAPMAGDAGLIPTNPVGAQLSVSA